MLCRAKAGFFFWLAAAASWGLTAYRVSSGPCLRLELEGLVFGAHRRAARPIKSDSLLPYEVRIGGFCILWAGLMGQACWQDGAGAPTGCSTQARGGGLERRVAVGPYFAICRSVRLPDRRRSVYDAPEFIALFCGDVSLRSTDSLFVVVHRLS